jgi:hypothetical protein
MESMKKAERFSRRHALCTAISKINLPQQTWLEISHITGEYSALMYDRYFDATQPFGKIINAFLLVERWHLQFLLWIVGGFILSRICIVAVTTAASHSFDSGLAAGSYAIGFGAVMIAILTFLSAVLWCNEMELVSPLEQGLSWCPHNWKGEKVAYIVWDAIR